MRKISFALVGAAALAVGACGGTGDDTLGDNVQDNMEIAADSLDDLADNTAGAEAATLENQAAELRDAGENAEDAIDDADVNAQQVNAM